MYDTPASVFVFRDLHPLDLRSDPFTDEIATVWFNNLVSSTLAINEPEDPVPTSPQKSLIISYLSYDELCGQPTSTRSPFATPRHRPYHGGSYTSWGSSFRFITWKPINVNAEAKLVQAWCWRDCEYSNVLPPGSNHPLLLYGVGMATHTKRRLKDKCRITRSPLPASPPVVASLYLENKANGRNLAWTGYCKRRPRCFAREAQGLWAELISRETVS